MKKLIITESQAKRLGLIKESLIKEGVADTYSRQVKLSYYYSGASLKGHEIDYITDTSVVVKYVIEVEAREWGIKDISLTNIVGPSQVDLEVEYYPNGDESQTISVPLVIDWSLLKTQVQSGRGVVTIDEEIEVTLVNDNEGNLVVSGIVATVYGL